MWSASRAWCVGLALMFWGIGCERAQAPVTAPAAPLKPSRSFAQTCDAASRCDLGLSCLDDQLEPASSGLCLPPQAQLRARLGTLLERWRAVEATLPALEGLAPKPCAPGLAQSSVYVVEGEWLKLLTREIPPSTLYLAGTLPAAAHMLASDAALLPTRDLYESAATFEQLLSAPLMLYIKEQRLSLPTEQAQPQGAEVAGYAFVWDVASRQARCWFPIAWSEGEPGQDQALREEAMRFGVTKALKVTLAAHAPGLKLYHEQASPTPPH